MKTNTTYSRRKTKGLFSLALIAVMSFLCVMTASATQNRSAYYKKTYALTGNEGADLVAVAKAQVNLTKGNLRYTEAWCANFVLDCARLAKLSDRVVPYNYASGGGCRYLYNYMMSSCGARTVTTPQAGDIVFYYCNSCRSYVHVGICEGNGYFIEGNVGGKVTRYNTSYIDSRGHSVKNKTVKRVYVHPNYKTSMNSCNIQLSSTSFTYTGGAIVPGYTVKYGSTVLKNGTDYTVSFSNNVNAGTASVTFTGKGNYAGTKKLTYRINAKNISGLSFSSVSNRAYTGMQIRPSVTVKNGKYALTNGTHYNVQYGTNKSTGRATITITGKGNYTGTKTITFYIVPKQVTGLKLKASRRTLTVSYSRATGATGYQIAYKKKWSKTWNAVKCSTTSKKLSLASLSGYDVRVRAYVQVRNGNQVTYQYGAWSKTMTKWTLF